MEPATVNLDGLRLGALVAALILFAGYAFVFRPMQAAIAARYADLDAVRSTLESDLAAARRIPALTDARDGARRRLSRYRLRDSRAATVDRFLHESARVAARYPVAIQSVAADLAPAPRATAPPATETVALDDLRLDVTVRGPYDDVLRSVRALNAGALATEISIAALGNTERRPGTRPQLTATFHVTLLREADASPIPTPHPT
jgi:Tfp pilus assembly protein PilO